MQIRYTPRPSEDTSINVPGNYLVSLKDGKTRDKGEIVRVLLNPKTQKPDPSFCWFLGKKGFPCKISNKNINTFRQATSSEIENHKNPGNED